MLNPFRYVSIAKNVTGAVIGYVMIKYVTDNITTFVPQIQSISIPSNIISNITNHNVTTNFITFVSNIIPSNILNMITKFPIPKLNEIIPILGAIASYNIFSGL